MIQLGDWARDLLMTRGALVESEGEGVLRALLPPEVSTKLSVSDWLSLDFSARGGADDPGEWMDRLSALLPPSPSVCGGRLRMRAPVGRIDTDAILNRELAIQNGVWRLAEDYAGAMPYYLFSFQYTVESDERTIGYASVCLNGGARAIAAQPERLLRSVRDELEDDPAFAVPAGNCARFIRWPRAAPRPRCARECAFIEQSANRRLARDCERMESYYGGLLAQLEKRAARRVSDPQAAEKEHSRIAATQLDRAAKLEDLVRKYSLRVRLELTDVLVASLPVRAISVKLLRKKEERPVTLALECVCCAHWIRRCANRAAAVRARCIYATRLAARCTCCAARAGAHARRAGAYFARPVRRSVSAELGRSSGRSTTVRKAAAVQHHGVMRQRFGLADLGAPSARGGLQCLKQRLNQPCQPQPESPNSVLAKPYLPAPFDRSEQFAICLLRRSTFRSETGDLRTAAAGVRLDNHAAFLLQNAEGHGDGLFRDAAQQREIADQDAFLIQHSQHVGADCQRQIRLALELHGEGQQHAREERRKRERIDIVITDARSELGIRAFADEPVFQNR